MSTDNEDTPHPKSMRHKQVLDAAADHPDASLDELAAMVPSATQDLVERVLDEHGDPAAENPAGSTADDPTPEEHTEDDQPGVESADEERPAAGEDAETETPTLTDLTDKQRAVLEYVAMDPTATQREIGERLDIAAATVSNRVTDIDGVAWSERRAFVTELFEGTTESSSTKSVSQSKAETDQSEGKANDSGTNASTADGGLETTPEPAESSDPTTEPSSATSSKSEASEESTEETTTTESTVENSESAAAESDGTAPTGHDIEAQLEALSSRLDALSEQMDASGEQSTESEAVEEVSSVLDDPELVHKTVESWLEDERFSKAEEVALMQALFS